MQTEKRAGRVMRNVAAVLVIILAIVALFQGFRMRGKEALFRNVAVETENLPEEKQSGDDRAKIACEQGKEVTYQGEKYVYNEDLVSILFLGVDKEAFEEGGTVGDGKAGQADALFLLVLDKEPPGRDLTRYDDGCQRLFRPWKFYRNGKAAALSCLHVRGRKGEEL